MTVSLPIYTDAAPVRRFRKDGLQTPIWRWAIAACFSSILLLLPAWYNGQPIMFPDSVGYERAGAVSLAVMHIVSEPGVARGTGAFDHGSDGVSTTRSPYYGVPLTLAIDAGGIWMVAVLQALGVATALLLAMRRLRFPVPLAVATVAGLAAFTGVAVFSSALMPDVFIGLLVLSFAMLVAVPELPRAERLLWLLAIVVATLFHEAFLAVGIAMTIAAALFAGRLLIERSTVMLLAVCCLLGISGHLLVDICVQRLSGQVPVGVPFLLARYAASPVLSDYLHDNCKPARLVLCRYRERLPLAPDQFLWGKHGVYTAVPNVDRFAIAAEADTVLRGAFAARPVAAAIEAVRGGVVQLFTVGMGDYALGIPAATAIDARLAPAMVTYPASAIARRSFPFDPLRLLALVAYLGGATAIATLAISKPRILRVRRHDQPRIGLWLAVLLTGVVVNAMVSGVLSGVFERYQGRMVWLLPFGAAVLWHEQRVRSTRTAPWYRPLSRNYRRSIDCPA